MHSRIPNSTPTDRRLHREARSAEQRKLALALRRDGATYAVIAVALGVCLERARRITRQAERLADHPRWFDSLPQRAISFLRAHGLDALPEIEAARALANVSRRELLSTPNFGGVSLSVLCDWMGKHGFALRPP